jgi:hypothetical protein
MKPPRFTLRFLLVVVTIAAVGLGVGRRLYAKRPVTEWECESVKAGMTELEVRWRLGAPHHVGTGRGRHSYGFDYADTEGLPLNYFHIAMEGGRVLAAEQRSYLPERWTTQAP